MFDKFPELLMIDATYKLTELRTLLYVLLVVDGSGNSKIVAIYLTVEESEPSIQDLAETFKKHNPSWRSTKVIITDKDMTERNVFSKEFPDAVMYLCLFHTLQTFKREFSCEKMNITAGQHEHLLELLQEMTYAKSETAYQDAYKSFKDTNINPAIEYFDKNWHSIRNEWVLYAKGGAFSLGETTNNRLESINGKIKSVCSKFATFLRYFNEFFVILAVLREERSHGIVMSMIKKPTRQSYPELSTDEMQYASLLTPYAFDRVAEQAVLRKKVVIKDNTIASLEGALVVDKFSCQCSIWTMFHLPCRHIFAIRATNGFNLYDKNLVAIRCTLDFAFLSHSHSATQDKPSIVDHSSTAAETAHNRLPGHQKYRKALKVCQELASLASEVGMTEFTQRMETLNQTKQEWMGSCVNGKEQSVRKLFIYTNRKEN